MKIRGVELHVVYRLYYNGRLAVDAVLPNGEVWGHISINVPEIELAKDEFVVNHDLAKNVVEGLLAYGLFEDTGRKASYGFVEDQPIFRMRAK